MFNNMLMGAAGESTKATSFAVDNSMLLNDDDSQYLIRENASNSGSGRTKFTVSLWWKHGNIPSGGQNLFIQRNSSSNYMKCAIAGSGGNEAALQFFGATLGAFGTGDSTALLRDFHAWYHILFYYDSMDSTAGDRARIYLNGVRLTDFQTSATNPSLGAITQFGSNNAMVIGQNQGASGYSDGYIAEMAVVDGNALLPSSFTESDSNGVLRPIEIKAENLLNYSTTDETNGASATASGDAGNAGNAIDDNDSTQWSEGSAATSAGATWTVTFSSAKHIRKITQYVASGNNVATGQKLQYYNGSTFVDAGAFTMEASSTKQTFYFDESASSTQWRLITTTAVGNPYSWALNEVEMFEASNGFGDQGFYLPFTTAAGLGQDYSGSSSTTQVQANLETGNNETNNGDMSGAAAGIAFTARATAKVSSIQIRTSSTGMSNCTVQVKQDGGTGQSPSGSVLTNGEVTGVSQSGQGYATFTFPNGGPDVTAGTTYWFMIPSTVGTWGLARDNDNSESVAPYVGGRIDSGGYNSGSFGHKIFQTGNHFLAINSPTQTSDSPTSNFATLSTIDTSPAVFSEGNLKVTSSTSNSYRGGTSTIGLPPGSGKWYVEAKTNGASTGGNVEYVFGAATNLSSKAAGYFPGSSGTSDEFGYYSGSGGYLYNNPNSAVSGVGAYGSGSVDTVALRFDMDASSPTCKFYVNNTLKHTANLTTGTTYFPHFNIQDSSLAWTVNFGATAFTYTLPTDHLPISAENMFTRTSPTIEDGSAYFQTTTYSGTGSAREVNQSGNSQFTPDFVWVKKRNGVNEHRLIDAVRGATKTLFSDGTAAESTESTGVTSFDSDGFSVGTGGGYNNSSGTYVGWQWLAGNSTASNSNGSITSTVSVNQRAGFSIVSYTGTGSNATVGHGLGAVPTWFVVKGRSTSGKEWVNYHHSLGNSNVVWWNQSLDKDSSSNFQSTDPTSTVFSIGTGGDVNTSGVTYIAYVWCEKPGFSKFSSYEGNGNADGPFVELGFKPSWTLIKNVDTSGDSWVMQDSVREPHNAVVKMLQTDQTQVEVDSAGFAIDYLSNGFKVRGAEHNINESDKTHIYMAFAEHPFAGTTPATAR